MSEPIIGIPCPAPLVDRLERRSWDDDTDDRSRELLEEAAGVIRLQAYALAEIARAVRSRQCRGRRGR